MDKSQSTGLLFEISHKGRRCHLLPDCDVPTKTSAELLDKNTSAMIRLICLRWQKLTSSGTSLIYLPKTWLSIATFILWEVAP